MASKELKAILTEAEKQGWRVKPTKKGHYMLFAPDGKNKVLAAGTASDHRSLDNLLSRMRRYGFEWKGR